jgi:diacylglycerol kinase
MKEVLAKHTVSFRHAFAGLSWAIRTQPNFRIHLILSAIALGFSWYFGITHTEWAIIIFAIVLGLTAELINTAIESMTDLITKEWREEAKIAKDVAAGMMLTTAIGAVIVACFIFLPYFGIIIHF